MKELREAFGVMKIASLAVVSLVVGASFGHLKIWASYHLLDLVLKRGMLIGWLVGNKGI